MGAWGGCAVRPWPAGVVSGGRRRRGGRRVGVVGSAAGVSSGRAPGSAGDGVVTVGGSFVADPLGYLERVWRRYGGVVEVAMAGVPVVLVLESGAAAGVLGPGSAVRRGVGDEAAAFAKRGTAFLPGSDLAGEGMLTSDGAVWRRQRRMAQGALGAAAVASYAPGMVRCADAMLAERWLPAANAGRAVDLYGDLNELTLDVAMESLFGVDPGGADARGVREAIGTALDVLGRKTANPLAMALPEWFPTPDAVRERRAVETLDAFLYALIDARRLRRQRGGGGPSAGASGTRPCLLDLLLEAHDAGPAREDIEAGVALASGRERDAALRDELMTMLVAGQETSAIVLAWTLCLLGEHPEWEAQAVAEVDSVLRAAGRLGLAAEDVDRLPLTEAVLLESMRLYPPAYIVGRCVQSDGETVGGYAVARGTTVLVSPYVLHRDEATWGADAAAFDPGRWGPDARAQWRERQGRSEYVPFGAGQRACIGMGFAMQELVLVLATVLRRVEVRRPRGAPRLEDLRTPRLTMRPGAPLPALVRRRVRLP